jgi:hypothetical protein
MASINPPDNPDRYAHTRKPRRKPSDHKGPYSKLYTSRASSKFGLIKVDGRTKEAALLQRVRKELSEHVGPNPTYIQNYLIDRAAILSLRLAQIDQRIIDETPLTILDNSQTVAWQNALTRVLVALGVKKDAVKRPSLTDINAEVGLK